jgi:hypothetical protein
VEGRANGQAVAICQPQAHIRRNGGTPRLA